MVKKKRTYKKKEAPLPALARRRVRYILFRLKRGAEDTLDKDLRMHADAIKEHFDRELKEQGRVWAGFTFNWDVSPTDPYKIIAEDVWVWVTEGGSFDGKPQEMTSPQWAQHVLSRLRTSKQKAFVPFDPPAFTKQE